MTAVLSFGVAWAQRDGGVAGGRCGRFPPAVLSDSAYGTPSLRPLGLGKYGFAHVQLCFDSVGRPHGAAVFIGGGQADLFPTQRTEVQFDAGVLNGSFRVLQDTRVMAAGRMRLGRRSGEFVEYRAEDGTIATRSQWTNGIEVGPKQWVEPSGQVTRTLDFVEGRCVWRGDDVPPWAEDCIRIKCPPSRVRGDYEGQFCTGRRGERHGPFLRRSNNSLMSGEYREGAPSGDWLLRDLSDGGVEQWAIGDFIAVVCDAGTRRVVGEDSVRCLGSTGIANGPFAEWVDFGQAVVGRFRNGFPSGRWWIKSGNAPARLVADFESAASWPTRCPRGTTQTAEPGWWSGSSVCESDELTQHGPSASWRGIAHDDGGVSLSWVFSVYDGGLPQRTLSGELAP